MQTIYLDISNKGVIPTIHAKQGDVGRKFQVVLTDSGLPYIPVGGSAFSVWYSGASGEGNYTEVGDKSAFSVSGNKVTVEMISQMLSNDGEGILSLVLNDPNGNQISTWNIHYVCEYVPGAGSQEAKAYYTAFSQAVENLPYPDASLSVSGKAADAAATGKALAGKAPAGYGLGGESRFINHTDLLSGYTSSGFYYWNSANTDPNKPFIAGELLVIKRVDGYCKQIAFSSDHTVPQIQVRTIHNLTVSAWDWVNPPMEPGKEYRTTKRYKGKAVYAYAIDCGKFPATSGVAEAAHKRAVTAIVDSGAEIYYGDKNNNRHLSAPYVTGTSNLYVSANENNFVLYSAANGFGDYGAIAWMEYTKD